jgi:hypothetical protein
MKLKKSTTISALAACLVIGMQAGCAAGAESPETPSTGSQQSVDSQDPELLARETLSHFLSVPGEKFKLVVLNAVQWSDSSLGCPQPGMAYAQVITPGYRAIFAYAGHTYHVHMARGRALVCENPADDIGIGYEIPPLS